MKVTKRDNKLIKKLKSKAGESLTEVLVALLISSIAMVMFATMISSSTKIIGESESAINTYYENGEKLEKMNTAGENGTITIKQGQKTFYLDNERNTQIRVKCYKNEDAVSYKAN